MLRIAPPELWFSCTTGINLLQRICNSRPRKKKIQMSIDSLNLPPGFRFHPTDDELVEHYLCRKCAGSSVPAQIIAEIDLYKFDPWQLPAMAIYGEKEWYFFSPRDRKYPNGSRPNRAAGTGYWKATGADKPIGRPKTLGIKKALVFYTGRAPAGVKTNWIMHEYRLANVDRSAGKNKQLKLDDWVLCRIYNKKGTTEEYSSKILKRDKELIQHPCSSMADSLQMESGSPPWVITDSSASPSLVMASEREVQSAITWCGSTHTLDYHMDESLSDAICVDSLSPLLDMFMFMQKP